MGIRVDNVYTYQHKEGEIAIYVGRQSSAHKAPETAIKMTELANDNVMAGEKDRDAVIAMYEVQLEQKLGDVRSQVFRSINAIAELAKASEVVLLCFCYPKGCHANVIADKVMEIVSLNPRAIEEEHALEAAERYGAIESEVDHSIGIDTLLGGDECSEDSSDSLEE